MNKNPFLGKVLHEVEQGVWAVFTDRAELVFVRFTEKMLKDTPPMAGDRAYVTPGEWDTDRATAVYSVIVERPDIGLSPAEDAEFTARLKREP